jgi:hypothetical protein
LRPIAIARDAIVQELPVKPAIHHSCPHLFTLNQLTEKTEKIILNPYGQHRFFQFKIMKLANKILFALLATPTLASAANIVTNGGFEAGSTGWSSTATTGFAPISAYGPCCSPSGIYPAGTSAAFFGWGNLTGGQIWQDIPTSPGERYDVTFSYGAISGASLQTLDVSALAGPGYTTVLGSLSLSAIGTPNLASLLSDYIFSFTATSAYTRLLFADTSLITNSVDGVLDNVSANAMPVPVPATLALLAAGLGLIGVTKRKKAL